MALPLSTRALFAWVAVSSAALMGFALYLQHVLNEIPCPLCITQRIFVIAIGVVALLAAIINPQALARRATAGLMLVLAIAGAAVAGRHVWLQSLPPELAPSCGPPLSFMRQTMGPLDVVRKVLTGSGNCGDVDWTWLGLGMPAWSLIGFLLLAAWGLLAALRRRKGRGRP